MLNTINLFKIFKYLNNLGGCGSCAVNAEIYDFESKQFVNVSLNSVSYYILFIYLIILTVIIIYHLNKCLFPLYSCNNMKITTIEGLGNKSTGYNEIQKRLIDNNGSQCGFCTPGMVINMVCIFAFFNK